MMPRRAGVPKILAAALLAAACSDSLSSGPERPRPAVPSFDVAADGPTQSGALGEHGFTLAKGFGGGNPHRGSAIIATFFWYGSTNIIDTVTDHLSNATPVGNTYTLVQYTQAGGISMATYVALNAQGFPDAYHDPSGDSTLVVQATMTDSVPDGGVMISAWTGVSTVGQARSDSGSGQALTSASGGSIQVNAGALVYGVTMANAVVQADPPGGGFTQIGPMSDAVMWTDGEYAVQASAGSLNTGTGSPPPPPPPPPAPPPAAAAAVAFDTSAGSLNERPVAPLFEFAKGFDGRNPHLGSAVVVTFFWHGSATINRVRDNLSCCDGGGTLNNYQLVDFVRAADISMVTYVALNAQNFPPLYHDPAHGDSILVVRAAFTGPVAGGLMLSSWTGAATVGAFHSASGTGSTATQAAPGAIAVDAGSVAYGVTMSNAVVQVAPPAGYTNIETLSDS